MFGALAESSIGAAKTSVEAERRRVAKVVVNFIVNRLGCLCERCGRVEEVVVGDEWGR